MNIRSWTLALLIGLAAPTVPARGLDHGHGHAPLHGGLLAESGETDYELVVGREALHLYVRKRGKAVDTGRGTAKLSLLGAIRQEVRLQPDGSRFSALGSFSMAPGSKAIAQITLDGLTEAVRFTFR